MNYTLGIDTSNYKTSIAIIDENGNVVFEQSDYLDVKKGERGLRQSTAFFMHSNKLPEFIDNAFQIIGPSSITSIGASSRPRRIEGSYMPCFLAGLNSAKIISTTLGIPVYEFSHQEGHAAAVVPDKYIQFVFFHLSGGTTEILLSTTDNNGYDTTILGGSKDISIGQLIDRVGVALGYGFPAGMYLDQLVSPDYVNNKLFADIKTSENEFNLSGIETKILRQISDMESPNSNEIVSTLFYKISKMLYELAKRISQDTKVPVVYMAGGVSSSKSIRTFILDFYEKEIRRNIINPNFKIIFGEEKYCGDNAVGIARLASRIHNNR